MLRVVILSEAFLLLCWGFFIFMLSRVFLLLCSVLFYIMRSEVFLLLCWVECFYCYAEWGFLLSCRVRFFVMLSDVFLLLYCVEYFYCYAECGFYCQAQCYIFVVMLSDVFLLSCWVQCFYCYADCNCTKSRYSEFLYHFVLFSYLVCCMLLSWVLCFIVLYVGRQHVVIMNTVFLLFWVSVGKLSLCRMLCFYCSECR